MKRTSAIYRPYLHNKSFLLSVGVGIVLLIAGITINYYAGLYATEKASSPVTDLVLNNIPVFDVDGIFVYGPVVMWLFVAGLLFARPQRIPFTLKSIAIFAVVRSAFVTLTHIGPFPNQIIVNYTSDLVKIFTSGGDLFFSGHTGLPFLMALVFWKNPALRAFFITAALLFGTVVLMAHLHYSIDVLAAFFITFSIYHIAKAIFKEDAELFSKGLGETSTAK